jgi:hypothetical protein
VRERQGATIQRRVSAGLIGLAFLVVGLMLQNGFTIVFAVVGAAILLSVVPYGSTSFRRGRRYR